MDIWQVNKNAKQINFLSSSSIRHFRIKTNETQKFELFEWINLQDLFSNNDFDSFRKSWKSFKKSFFWKFILGRSGNTDSYQTIENFWIFLI